MIVSRALRTTLKVLNKLDSSRECPFCGWTGFQFMPAGEGGDLLRFDAACPRCGSLERHRLVRFILNDELDRDLGRVLHFAPEIAIQRWIEPKARDYHTADIEAGIAMHQVDIQKMQFEDGSFDLVWCSHVLEHIPDDAAAISEIARVLAKGGLAVIMVPRWGKTTIEGDLPLQERIRVYYQHDHVRRYGADILERLKRPGFTLTVRNIEELDRQSVFRFALNDSASSEIFLLRKS